MYLCWVKNRNYNTSYHCGKYLEILRSSRWTRKQRWLALSSRWTIRQPRPGASLAVSHSGIWTHVKQHAPTPDTSVKSPTLRLKNGKGTSSQPQVLTPKSNCGTAGRKTVFLHSGITSITSLLLKFHLIPSFYCRGMPWGT